MEIKQVTIPVRDKLGYLMGTRDVLVEWVCPECGETMGDARIVNYSEDDHHYAVSQWENRCGHIAHYDKLVIVEEL